MEKTKIIIFNVDEELDRKIIEMAIALKFTRTDVYKLAIKKKYIRTNVLKNKKQSVIIKE